MLKIKRIAFLLILVFGPLILISFVSKGRLKQNVVITINENQNLIYQLPDNDEDWFDMKFNFIVKNDGVTDIIIANPNAYKIFPHPWIIKLDGKVTNKWSGSPMCAPSFKESDIIQIKSGESRKLELYWSHFTKNFSRAIGKHELSIKYEINLDSTFTMGANKDILSGLEIGWSNSVEIEIKK